MANFQNVSPAMSAMPAGFSDVDTIWEMGSTTLLQTNSQLLVPERLAVNLTDGQIMELRSRLSRFCGGAQTVAMRDAQSNGLRICPSSNYQTPSMTSSPSASPVTLSNIPSPESSASHSGDATSNHIRSPGKKSKVPRPANAFILYRKQNHPHLKTANPDMHNNEISIILGKQWKNEADSVKTVYKHMADKLKRKHAEDNPGYQYAPRKPSEKKRRMTPRKRAVQRAAADAQDPRTFPIADMIEVADHERFASDGVFAPDENPTPATKDISKTSHNSPSHASYWLETSRRSSSADLFRVDEDTQEVNLTMPAPKQPLQQQISSHYNNVNGLLPFDPNWLATTPAQHSTNEQDFLNSLVDWEGIQQDANIIRKSTTVERDDLAAAETGDTHLLAWDSISSDDLQKELDRIMKMI